MSSGYHFGTRWLERIHHYIKGVITVNSDKDHDQLGEYLHALEERGNHLYDPGYWIGGKHVPPHIKYGNQGGRGLRSLGIIFLFFGLTSLIGLFFNFMMFSSLTVTHLLSVIGAGVLVLVGVRLVVPKKKKPKIKGH